MFFDQPHTVLHLPESHLISQQPWLLYCKMFYYIILHSGSSSDTVCTCTTSLHKASVHWKCWLWCSGTSAREVLQLHRTNLTQPWLHAHFSYASLPLGPGGPGNPIPGCPTAPFSPGRPGLPGSPGYPLSPLQGKTKQMLTSSFWGTEPL